MVSQSDYRYSFVLSTPINMSMMQKKENLLYLLFRGSVGRPPTAVAIYIGSQGTRCCHPGIAHLFRHLSFFPFVCYYFLQAYIKNHIFPELQPFNFTSAYIFVNMKYWQYVSRIRNTEKYGMTQGHHPLIKC
ncbi:hypothetical protein LOAG_10372 [Loa loa]|uniref:Uncharacterized protein n=1 Tax=Loa loa TaxID=7209 RepID=A0A1S0TQ11_LOALO|nr:hypothetical protein LOAG_10372 [Loa loa]EFO18126.1 hypothetical protein LOAG_10372 [Loa loa]